MIKQKLKTILQFIINPRLLLCFGVGWMITNGWAYILFATGSYFQIAWMITLSGTYLAFLWFPFSMEKIVTFAIAILLMQWWFPHDTKTLGALKTLRQKTIDLVKRKKKEKAERKKYDKSRDI